MSILIATIANSIVLQFAAERPGYLTVVGIKTSGLGFFNALWKGEEAAATQT